MHLQAHKRMFGILSHLRPNETSLQNRNKTKTESHKNVIPTSSIPPNYKMLGYHSTTKENAENIEKTGFYSGNVYFTEYKNFAYGQASVSVYGPQEKVQDNTSSGFERFNMYPVDRDEKIIIATAEQPIFGKISEVKEKKTSRVDINCWSQPIYD